MITRFNLGTKIAALLLTIMLIGIINAVIILTVAQQMKESGRTINLAGRQRMLIQKMSKERQQLAELARQVRSGLHEAGLKTGGESHIVPVMIGDERQAVAVAEQLRQKGFWVQAVRTPTVPRGTARLRLSLSASIKAEQLATLPKQIAEQISSA